MARAKPLSAAGLVLGTSYISTSIGTSFALDQPLLTFVVLLASVGLLLFASERLWPLAGKSSDVHSYAVVPGEENHELQSRLDIPVQRKNPNGWSSSIQSRVGARGTFVALVLAICIRVDISRHIVNDVQCAGRGYSPFIPFLIATYDYMMVQRKNPSRITEDAMGSTVFDNIYKILQVRVRYVVLAFLLGWSSYQSISSSSAPKTSYICSPVSSAFNRVPGLQVLALLLDCITLIVTSHVLERGNGNVLAWLGSACLAASITLVSFGVLGSLFQGTMLSVNLPGWYAWSLVKLLSGTCFTALCGLQTIYYTGAMTASLLVVFTWTYTITLYSSWIYSAPFPSISRWAVLFFVLVLIVSFAFYFIAESISEPPKRGSSRPTFTAITSRFHIVAILLYLLQLTAWLLRTGHVSYHPADLLVHSAGKQHVKWLHYAQEMSLHRAARRYRLRYGRNPPPGFDVWYEYANTRSSVIINDFDGIDDDLLLHWTLSPEELRQKTLGLIHQPSNDIGGISIRNGKATLVVEDKKQRTVLGGVSAMISPFVQWLPDMDVAFNTAKDSRVVLNHEVYNRMHVFAEGTINSPETASGFSDDRTGSWRVPKEVKNSPKWMDELYPEDRFFRLGATACPATSIVWSQRHWNVGELCVSCTNPHSLGQFLSDWTLSTSICHQPDLANLHGFYLTSRSPKVTQDLMPVFSVRRAPGFIDILYPSLWDYDRAGRSLDDKPASAFDNKTDVLYWRGAASESVSTDGSWTGMTPQRLAFMASHSKPPPIILLPLSNFTSVGTLWRKGQLAYTPFSSSSLRSDIELDEPKPGLCSAVDCADQAAVFSATKEDVANDADEDYYRSRYLLSLDDDFDDENSKGHARFLDALASRSVPFRASIFRRWYDSRLRPWLHYVPIDVRLHGLYSTLAYFTGVEKRRKRHDGPEFGWDPRRREAEMIADEGRAWAAKTLRKEDMEIYLFRLLLEWGRLTDDNRDQLGFIPEYS